MRISDWSSDVCSSDLATERPDYHATYTNNWPPEPLIDNHPTAENIMWSLACVIIMLAGIGLLNWGWAFLRSHEHEPQAPAKDSVLAVGLPPSQKALGKYLFDVVALFVFRSEEHTSELQYLMLISTAALCLKK